MAVVQSILIAVSLCADCFAVSLCSGVTLREVSAGRVLPVAAMFALIQTALLLVGWMFGNVFVGLAGKVAHVIGFLLLSYVGGSMLVEGIRGDLEVRNLSGLKNVMIGGVATSIDALAVGAAQSMAGVEWKGLVPLLVSVAAVTALSVVAGLFGGSVIGRRTGRWSEIAGGIVLVGIGVGVLLRF